MRAIQITALVIVLLAIPFGAAFYYVTYQQTAGVAVANADTDVTRQSNQYVTTQQERLFTLMNGYERAASDGQRRAIIEQMESVAGTLTADRIPAPVARFLATNR